MGNQSKKTKKRELAVQGIGIVGQVARDNLERVGGLLDDLNAKGNKASKYQAVDLEKFEVGTADNLFSQQTLKASQQLLGNRFATYGKYAKKVVPDSMFQKVTDSAFAQIAKLAASWSQIDLPHEQRFEGIQGLDDQERNALARDISNQNRALATMGGVTGLAGLPGMLADTLWLLLVSLRTVYQLATVYDKPLTGKQGVKMAYAVLSNADLSKMQEKQAILAGLGVAKGLLENADNRGLRSELQNMGIKNSNVSYYAEQVDRVAEQLNINIDNINLSWLTKFLPLVSVGVNTHYNHHLINEVIGVANATFAPEPRVATDVITDQSTKKGDSKADKQETNKQETNKPADTQPSSSKSSDASADKSGRDNTDDKKSEALRTETAKANNNRSDANSSDDKPDANPADKGAS